MYDFSRPRIDIQSNIQSMRSAFSGWNPYCRNDTEQRNPEFRARTASLDIQNDQEMGSINPLHQPLLKMLKYSVFENQVA